MTKYTYKLLCPRCGKVSETASEGDTPSNVRVNCGDCLMSAVEIVPMIVTKITEARKAIRTPQVQALPGMTPLGIKPVSLDNPATLHNTLKDVLGE